jgi:hypothetical protein
MFNCKDADAVNLSGAGGRSWVTPASLFLQFSNFPFSGVACDALFQPGARRKRRR